MIFFRYEVGVLDVVNVLEGHRDADTDFRNDAPQAALLAEAALDENVIKL